MSAPDARAFAKRSGAIPWHEKEAAGSLHPDTPRGLAHSESTSEWGSDVIRSSSGVGSHAPHIHGNGGDGTQACHL